MPEILTTAPQNDDVAKQIRDLLITAGGETEVQRINMMELLANTAPLLERKIDIGSLPFAPTEDFALLVSLDKVPGVLVFTNRARIRTLTAGLQRISGMAAGCG